MTRAKEITKEAKKFAKEIDDWEIAEDVQDAFEQGAQWADSHPHWISVEERKPKFKHENDGFRYSEAVIVTDGEYCTSANWVHSTLVGWYDWFNGDGELKGVTHWMRLPSIEHLKD